MVPTEISPPQPHLVFYIGGDIYVDQPYRSLTSWVGQKSDQSYVVAQLAGKQPLLFYQTGTGITPLTTTKATDNSKWLKSLKVESPIQVTDDDANQLFTIKLDQPTVTSSVMASTSMVSALGAKQNSLQISAPSGSTPLMVGTAVKALQATYPITLANDDTNKKITVGIDNAFYSDIVFNPYWVAGMVAGNAVILHSYGRYPFTTVLNTTSQIIINFVDNPHPRGSGMLIQTSIAGNDRMYIGNNVTTTQFRVNFGSLCQTFYFTVWAG